MATPKKLPSGQWRTLVFSHYDFLTDDKGHPVIDPKTGKQKTKRIYESFTADTKKESAFMAAEYQMNKKRIQSGDLTVKEAMEEYIKTKENVLSPSTIRGYISCINNYYSEIQDIKLRRLEFKDVQMWINNLSASKSPKTTRNANALLTATFEMFAPEIHFAPQLPAKKKTNLYCPSDTDIEHLLKYVAGRELELAILLAAFGPMRRSEICALTSDDIHGNIITVNKAMVLTVDNQWIIKPPKTFSSNRDIEYPKFVIEKLKGIKGPLVKATPDQISNRFRRAIKFSGSPEFRFHDLRHYGASIMHAIGIPDQYIMERGGWKTDSVMKSIYRNTITEEMQKANSKINDHFSAMQHDMQHGH